MRFSAAAFREGAAHGFGCEEPLHAKGFRCLPHNYLPSVRWIGERFCYHFENQGQLGLGGSALVLKRRCFLRLFETSACDSCARQVSQTSEVLAPAVPAVSESVAEAGQSWGPPGFPSLCVCLGFGAQVRLPGLRRITDCCTMCVFAAAVIMLVVGSTPCGETLVHLSRGRKRHS